MEPRTQARTTGQQLGIAPMASADPADRRPAQRARLANALLPGSGLGAQGRPIVGLLLGLAFYWPLSVAIYVAWISPSALPRWVTIGLTVWSVAVYLAAQWVLARVLDRRTGRIADYAARAVPMMRAAYSAMSDGDWIEAQLRLDELLAFDLEHFEANLTQARLLAIGRKFDQAQRAYRTCRRLDSRSRWRWEIDRETALLGDG